MRIGIDTRSLLEGTRTGVGEYLYNLLKGIARSDQDDDYILFSNAYHQRDLGIQDVLKNGRITLKEYKYPNKLLNLSFQVLKYPKIDKMLGGPDIMILPNITFEALSDNTKMVLVIHDLSFVWDPSFFSRKKRLWHKFVNPKGLIDQADKIIAVSESTKGDLLRLFGAKEEKVSVIYPGIDKSFEPYPDDALELIRVKDKYKLPNKFILYLGTLEPRKNIVGLIQAFEELKRTTDLPYQLVIAGGKGWLYEDIFAKQQSSKYRDSIKFVGFIDHEDKVAFYNLADVFCYPSFYEGFGFPPLEAMASGTPVVASSVASLPEILGDDALLVDPYNVSEITLGIKSVLEDRTLADRLKQKGLMRADKFNWEDTVSKTLDCFKEVA